MRSGRSSRLCSIAGCEHTVVGFGYCQKHYLRLKKNGSPHALKNTPASEGMAWIETCALKYEEDECLKWPFPSRGPRPRIHLKGRPYSVSQVICEKVNGVPPSQAHEAAHSCGNGWCVNKSHIRWATPQENTDDKKIHGTIPRGEQVHTARINEGQVRFIRSSPMPGRELAQIMGISEGIVYAVRQRKAWRHVE